MSPAEFDAMVNHQSGLLGVSETSADMRDLIARRATDPRAAEAVSLFCYSARRWIGSLAASLGGLETLVFSGGIGEHSPEVRAEICAGLEFLGVTIDPDPQSPDTTCDLRGRDSSRRTSASSQRMKKMTIARDVVEFLIDLTRTQMTPVQRPARRAEGIDPALDLGIVDQRRGVVRLDPGVDDQRPAQPQCFWCVNAPMPSMSAAGFDRVNVTQRKLFSGLRGELAVVDDHDQRERVDRIVGAERLAKASKRGIVPTRPRRNGGPERRARPAAPTRGVRKPSGVASPTATSPASSRRFGPAAAITTFDPWFSPCPE